MDARIATPFWDFYQNDDDFKERAEFKGFINHEFEGKSLKSSIYKIWSQNQKVAQYLIKPDPEYAKLFDIGESVKIYDDLPQSPSHTRALFLTTAFPATAALYRGKKQQKKFDILHYHPWTVGLLSNSIKDYYNPIKKLLGQPPVHVVQHFHSSSFEEQGFFPLNTYNSLGIRVPISKEIVDIQQESLLNLDMVIHVSNALAEKAVDPKRGGVFLNAFQNLKKQGRLVGVINGINHASFDITNKNTYKEFAIEQKIEVSEGKNIDSTDYILKKGEMKKTLFKEGIIADPEKPLFVFVDRFAYDKGIDVLLAMVKQIAKEGGQAVVMGCSSWLPPEIQMLQEYANNNPSILKVYITLKDQQTPLKNSSVSNGFAIRLASNFFLIPSNNESCGLVGLEGLAAGSILITS